MGLLTFKGGLHPYDGKELSKDKPITEYLPQGELVYPLSQHIGAPAVACVKKGDRVLVIGDYADDFYEGEYSSELLKTIREENKEYGLHNIYDYPYKELKNTSFYSNRLPSRYIYNDSKKNTLI